MMYCPDCDANLNDVPVGEECPNYGGRRREAIATPPSIEVKVAFPQGGLKVERSDHRPWTEKWMAMRYHPDSLADMYAGAKVKGGNLEVETSVNSFFAECHHLPDWLEGDIASLDGVSVADISEYFDDSEPLVIASAVSNSYKHHTRTHGTTARIRETVMDPAGARVTIEVDWATPNSSTEDGLDLANKCLDSWRSFFQRFGIVEP